MRVFDQPRKISGRGRPTTRIFGPFRRLGVLVPLSPTPQGTAYRKDLPGGGGHYVRLAKRYSKDFRESSMGHSGDSYSPGALPMHPTSIFERFGSDSDSRRLRISAFLSDSEVSDEDNEGAVTSDANHAVLASPAVVSVASRDGVRAGPSSAEEGSAVGPAASASGVTAVNRLEVVRRQFKNSGLSSKVVKLLLDGTRDTTSAAYQSAWSGWRSWCVQEHTDPVSPPLTKVLEFCHHW